MTTVVRRYGADGSLRLVIFIVRRHRRDIAYGRTITQHVSVPDGLFFSLYLLAVGVTILRVYFPGQKNRSSNDGFSTTYGDANKRAGGTPPRANPRVMSLCPINAHTLYYLLDITRTFLNVRVMRWLSLGSAFAFARTCILLQRTLRFSFSALCCAAACARRYSACVCARVRCPAATAHAFQRIGRHTPLARALCCTLLARTATPRRCAHCICRATAPRARTGRLRRSVARWLMCAPPTFHFGRFFPFPTTPPLPEAGATLRRKRGARRGMDLLPATHRDT